MQSISISDFEELEQATLKHLRYNNGFVARKSVFGGLQTAKAQTSLHIRLCNLVGWFEYHFAGNSEDRFSTHQAHIMPPSITPATSLQ